MTRAQAVAWANGQNNPTQITLAPGTDLASARKAIATAGDPAALAAFDAKYGNKMPGFGSGQSTAGRESQGKTAATVTERNQNIIADANVVPQDIENLSRMGQLASSSNFGPGASTAAKWSAIASQFPGMGLIVNPATLQQQQTNVTLMKKYMSDMAGRMSGASGTGTDARLPAERRGPGCGHQADRAPAHRAPHRPSGRGQHPPIARNQHRRNQQV
jgi:hypothetical protein